MKFPPLDKRGARLIIAGLLLVILCLSGMRTLSARRGEEGTGEMFPEVDAAATSGYGTAEETAAVLRETVAHGAYREAAAAGVFPKATPSGTGYGTGAPGHDAPGHDAPGHGMAQGPGDDAPLTGTASNSDAGYGPGFRLENNGLYYYGDGEQPVTGLFETNGSLYLADANGAVYVDGWVRHDGSWYCADRMGRLLRGMRSPEGYLLDGNGRLVLAGYELPEDLTGTYRTSTGRTLLLDIGQAGRIRDYLLDYGWTETAIAGVLGNFQQESGLDPTTVEAGSGIGFGLGQWSYGRRTALEAYARDRGIPVTDLYLQLDFLMYEPEENAYVYQYAHTYFDSAAQAARSFGRNWERFNESDNSMETVRVPYAEAYFRYFMEGGI